MEHPLVCLHEKDWGEVYATLKNINETLTRIEGKICSHIQEAEQPGGIRERLMKLEFDYYDFKKRFWLSSIIGGILGALIGSGSGDLISAFIKWLMHLS